VVAVWLIRDWAGLPLSEESKAALTTFAGHAHRRLPVLAGVPVDGQPTIAFELRRGGRRPAVSATEGAVYTNV
jgi:hypothetical protein